MTAKEWLNRGYYIEREIHQLESEREKTYNALLDTQKYKDKKNNTEDLNKRLTEYENELNKRIDNLYDIKQEILGVIGKIEKNNERDLLIARYISFHKWDRIAEALHYEVRHVYRLHHKALKSAEKIIKHD